MYDECEEYNDGYCYGCMGYGDDYRIDENGELIDACVDCPFNPSNQED